MLTKELSYCGFNCELCPIYNATIKENDAEIKMFLNLKDDDNPKDFYCKGCTVSNGKHLGFCEIKKCAGKEELNTCAFCSNFPCNKLDVITEETRKHLEELHKNK